MAVIRFLQDFPNNVQSNAVALGLGYRFLDINTNHTRAASRPDTVGIYAVVTGSGLVPGQGDFSITGSITMVQLYDRQPDGFGGFTDTLQCTSSFPLGIAVTDGNYSTEPFGGADRIYGFDGVTDAAGADVLSGLDGNDQIYGAAGDDFLNGGIDQDLLVCGTGNDDADGGDGNDTIWGGDANGFDGFSDTLAGGDGQDTVRLSGGGTAEGQVGDDRVFAGSLAATLSGGAGNDELYGSAAGDDMDGGAQSDIMYGRDGADVIVGDAASPAVPEAEHGNDLIYGGKGDDVIFGNAGDDTIFGDTGNDLLGLKRADSPVAEAGDDWLYGGNGRDTLACGQDNDHLYGGAGRDKFVFNQDFDTCVISDFVTKKQNGVVYDRVDFHMMVALGEAWNFHVFIANCVDQAGDVPRVVYDFGTDGPDGANVIIFENLQISDFLRGDIIFT